MWIVVVIYIASLSYLASVPLRNVPFLREKIDEESKMTSRLATVSACHDWYLIVTNNAADGDDEVILNASGYLREQVMVLEVRKGITSPS